MNKMALRYALAGAAMPAAIAEPISIPGEDLIDKIKGSIAKGIILMATAFTNAGAAIVTNRMISAGTAPRNIGWGTGGTAAAVGDTALVTEASPTTGGGRTVGTESRTTGSVTNDQYTVTGTVTSDATQTIQEAGLFDAVSAGNMLIRSNFTGVGVDNNDSIAFTFNLRFVPNAA